VFAERHRVLRSGRRIGITDVVTEDRLTDEERYERGSYVGCIAGALPFSEHANGLRADEVGESVQRATVKGTKP
jgi:hypothetical protein